jgi:hypothetical protein
MKHTTHPTALAAALTLAALLCLSACRQDDTAPVNKDASADKSDAHQMQPDEAPGVDLGRWKDMTWEDFDRLFATFAKSDPPVVRDFGICDSITCIFPSSAASAVAEILICDLNADYSVGDAFQLLGIETGRVLGSEAGWVNLASGDDRFSSLKYKTTEGNADRTRQLLVQFKR